MGAWGGGLGQGLLTPQLLQGWVGWSRSKGSSLSPCCAPQAQGLCCCTPAWPELGGQMPAGTGHRGRRRWCLCGWEPMSKQGFGAVPSPPRNDPAAQPAQQRLCFGATSPPPHCPRGSCSSTLGKKESVVPAQSHLLCRATVLGLEPRVWGEAGAGSGETSQPTPEL